MSVEVVVRMDWCRMIRSEEAWTCRLNLSGFDQGYFDPDTSDPMYHRYFASIVQVLNPFPDLWLNHITDKHHLRNVQIMLI